MSQVSTEVKINFREDTLPKNIDVPDTSDVIILGEDVYSSEIPLPSFATYNPDFIGPRDASNEARGLMLRQVESLAQIAVTNFSLYEDRRTSLVAAARQNMQDGLLNLNHESPKGMTVDQQAERFISAEVTAAAKPRQDVDAAIVAERIAQSLGSKGAERSLQSEVIRLNEIIKKQATQTLAVRSALVEGGASDEFMRKFDYTNMLMPMPEREVYEREMKLDPTHEPAPLVDTAAIVLLHKFKNALRYGLDINTKALRLIGIHSPKSGQIGTIR